MTSKISVTESDSYVPVSILPFLNDVKLHDLHLGTWLSSKKFMAKFWLMWYRQFLGCVFKWKAYAVLLHPGAQDMDMVASRFRPYG